MLPFLVRQGNRMLLCLVKEYNIETESTIRPIDQTNCRHFVRSDKFSHYYIFSYVLILCRLPSLLEFAGAFSSFFKERVLLIYV